MEEVFREIHVYWGVLAVLVAQILAWVRKGVKTDNRLDALEMHAEDEQKHWTTEKKMTIFVPRNEIEQRFENIERILFKIEKKIDK
tara:strand:+ start:168 stop:425 length:258 start_codon:yes stop_codon:yes gene_type:complete